jgi:hypothetical protein
MTNTKILAPSNDLFNQDYKLSYFCESLSKYEENQLKSENSNFKRSKKLKKWYKKDILHIEMFKPVCPECFTKNVAKNDFKKELFVFTIKVM